MADGPQRIRTSQDFQQKKAEIEKRIREKYSKTLAQASCWKKAWLYFKMSRELAKELEKLAPSRGLYFSS